MLPFDDLPFPSEASFNAGASADDSALFELPDVSDLEKKRQSRESKRKSKATSDAKVARSISEGTALNDFEKLYGIRSQR